jgi:hypothetical protein
MLSRFSALALFAMVARVATAFCADDPSAFRPLFAEEGPPKGWRVTAWADVKNPPPEGARWIVEQGILHGSTPRGSWLVSEAEFADFVLDLEFKIGPQGNSGVGLRFPDAGDPAFDGLELQIVDPRYYADQAVGPGELTGSLYKGVAPSKQVFKPTEWNHYVITCQGPRVKVLLNDELIQDVDLDTQTATLERGAPLKDRPRRGHIGLQELSRGGGHVQIRNGRIKELK